MKNHSFLSKQFSKVLKTVLHRLANDQSLINEISSSKFFDLEIDYILSTILSEEVGMLIYNLDTKLKNIERIIGPNILNEIESTANATNLSGKNRQTLILSKIHRLAKSIENEIEIVDFPKETIDKKANRYIHKSNLILIKQNFEKIKSKHNDLKNSFSIMCKVFHNVFKVLRNQITKKVTNISDFVSGHKKFLRSVNRENDLLKERIKCLMKENSNIKKINADLANQIHDIQIKYSIIKTDNEKTKTLTETEILDSNRSLLNNYTESMVMDELMSIKSLQETQYSQDAKETINKLKKENAILKNQIQLINQKNSGNTQYYNESDIRNYQDQIKELQKKNQYLSVINSQFSENEIYMENQQLKADVLRLKDSLKENEIPDDAKDLQERNERLVKENLILRQENASLKKGNFSYTLKLMNNFITNLQKENHLLVLELEKAKNTPQKINSDFSSIKAENVNLKKTIFNQSEVIQNLSFVNSQNKQRLSELEMIKTKNTELKNEVSILESKIAQSPPNTTFIDELKRRNRELLSLLSDTLGKSAEITFTNSLP